MNKKVILKNPLKEIRLFNQRLFVMLIFISLLFLCLILKLLSLQVFNHALYTTLSNKNLISVVPTPPMRGLIYDRNGIILAQNIPVFNLVLIPGKIINLKETIKEINKVIPLSNADLEQFNKQLKQHRKFDRVPIKVHLTEKEVAKFYVNQYRFSDVMVQADLLRFYPLAGTTVHALGYVGRVNVNDLKLLDPVNYANTNYVGKMGLEKYYEPILHGTVGYEQIETDANGRAIRTLNRQAPIAGQDIYISLDSKMQQIAETAFGKIRGALVAIKPATGEILALYSSPTYDPNLFVNGISQEDYKRLLNSPTKPLYNRAIRGQYPLASTIKPYLGLGALDLDAVTEQYAITDPGIYKLPNSSHIYHDWVKGGHGGVVDLVRAITVSCDIYFYQLANRLGIKRMNDILRRFGFGEKTNIDMHEELPGLIPTPEWKQAKHKQNWYPGDTVISGIGQGFMLATPLQLANALTILANRGKHFQPHFLLKVRMPQGQLLDTLPIELPTVAVKDPNYWTTVIHGMQNVISGTEGTARLRFGSATFTAAGKTGTAQVYSAGRFGYRDNNKVAEELRNHSLFVVFAPVDHPEIAIAVLAEHDGTAVQIARQVLDYYFTQELRHDAQPVSE